MSWPCQSCYLQGREDHTQAMADFGVRCPGDFVARLLPQGAWSRCSRCTSAARAEKVRIAGGASNRERQDAATASTHVCGKCGEEKEKGEYWPADWRRRSKADRKVCCKICQNAPPSQRRAAPLASQAVHLFGTCGTEQPQCQYWPADWLNRRHNVSCKTCQPLQPDARGPSQAQRQHWAQHTENQKAKAAARTFKCAECTREQARDAYFPGDVNNRYLYPLRCKTCRPTPPNERPHWTKARASG